MNGECVISGKSSSPVEQLLEPLFPPLVLFGSYSHQVYQQLPSFAPFIFFSYLSKQL